MTELTLHGETALRRLGALRGFFRSASASFTHDIAMQTPRIATGGFERHSARGSRRTTAGDIRALREVTLVRCVSVVEAYVMDLGANELNTRLSEDTIDHKTLPLVRYLQTKRWEPIARSGSWEQAVELWKNGLGTNPKSFAKWDAIDILRSERHAIVHRLGELTDQYRKKARSRLEGLGLDPVKAQGLIPISDTDVEDGLRLARGFVAWLDAKLLSERPT